MAYAQGAACHTLDLRGELQFRVMVGCAYDYDAVIRFGHVVKREPSRPSGSGLDTRMIDESAVLDSVSDETGAGEQAARVLHEECRWTWGLVESAVQRFRIVRGEACYDVGDVTFWLGIGEEQVGCFAIVVFSWKEHGFSFFDDDMGRGVASENVWRLPGPQ